MISPCRHYDFRLHLGQRFVTIETVLQDEDPDDPIIRIVSMHDVNINVAALEVPQCGECGELVFDYVAEAQINDAFRQVTIAIPSMPVRDAI